MERHHDYRKLVLRTLISEHRAANVGARRTEPPIYSRQPALAAKLHSCYGVPGATEPWDVTAAQSDVTAAYTDAVQHFGRSVLLPEGMNGGA